MKITKKQARLIKQFEHYETLLDGLKKAHPKEYKIYQGYKVHKSIKGE